MKKQIYQILYKGIFTNKLTIAEFKDMQTFDECLQNIKKSNYLQLLTTNIYTCTE